ncbi:hypothetical protein, partial [Paracoccus marinaquae]
MNFWKIEADSFGGALRLAAGVGLGVVALVAVTAAASIGLIGLLSKSDVMADASEVVGGFFDYYANTVGLAVAFVAGLATIFLALQALRVSSNQTALTARQTFNEDVREFRKEIAKADRECQELCVSDPAHAVSDTQAAKRSPNIMANWLRAANHSRTFRP